MANGKRMDFIDYAKERTLLTYADGSPHGLAERAITAERPVFLTIKQSGCVKRYRLDSSLPMGSANINKAMRNIVIEIDRQGNLVYQMSRKEGAEQVAEMTRQMGLPITPDVECGAER